MEFSIYWYGFALSFSLFATIGAQNVFVLKQALMQNHIAIVCLVCFVCDMVLVVLGVFGIAKFFSQNAYLTIVLGTLGSIFVLSYGLLALRSAYKTQVLNDLEVDSAKSCVHSLILQTLAITLFNPHVYLDTIAVIGAYSLTLDTTQKINFSLGAISASFVWFFCLGFFAYKASVFLKNKKVWIIINTLTAIIMFVIAYWIFDFTLQEIAKL